MAESGLPGYLEDVKQKLAHSTLISVKICQNLRWRKKDNGIKAEKNCPEYLTQRTRIINHSNLTQSGITALIGNNLPI